MAAIKINQCLIDALINITEHICLYTGVLRDVCHWQAMDHSTAGLGLN